MKSRYKLLLLAAACCGCGAAAAAREPAERIEGPPASAPAVIIKSPSTDAVVAGEIAVYAQAGGRHDEIVGVQFMLNGADLEAEDTAPPFSIGWNTEAAADGAHTLTARARLASGGTGYSDPVIVTVANHAPPARLSPHDVMPMRPHEH